MTSTSTTSTPTTMPPTPPLTIIVAATSSHLGIGLKGSLPWRLKREIAYFKRATTFHPQNLTNVVIMGRKCWESIPSKFRPLPGRFNIVLSRRGVVDGVTNTNTTTNSEAAAAGAGGTGVKVVGSLHAALEIIQRRKDLGRVFVIGGAEIYGEAMTLDQCNRILFTEVHSDNETDVNFPVEF